MYILYRTLHKILSNVPDTISVPTILSPSSITVEDSNNITNIVDTIQHEYVSSNTNLQKNTIKSPLKSEKITELSKKEQAQEKEQDREQQEQDKDKYKEEEKSLNTKTYYSNTNIPLGDQKNPSVQNLQATFIMTFNVAYPDYDFTNIDPNAFEPVKYGLQIIETINENILYPASSIYVNIKNTTWTSIDSVINIKDCSIFSYLNDPDNPIFSLGKLWSCNYFFFNKKLRRILLFSSAIKSKLVSPLLTSIKPKISKIAPYYHYNRPYHHHNYRTMSPFNTSNRSPITSSNTNIDGQANSTQISDSDTESLASISLIHSKDINRSISPPVHVLELSNTQVQVDNMPSFMTKLPKDSSSYTNDQIDSCSTHSKSIVSDSCNNYLDNSFDDIISFSPLEDIEEMNRHFIVDNDDNDDNDDNNGNSNDSNNDVDDDNDNYSNDVDDD